MKRLKKLRLWLVIRCCNGLPGGTFICSHISCTESGIRLGNSLTGSEEVYRRSLWTEAKRGFFGGSGGGSCIMCLSFFSVIHLQKAGPSPDVEFGRRAPSTLVVETCHYIVSKMG